MLQRASCLTLRRWCHSTSYLRHAAVSGLRNSSTQNSTWPLRPCFVTPSCQALVVRAHGTSTSDAQLQNEKKLTAIWEDHCRFEFETLDVDATMATMVDDPYVNHVPTMTGGTGYDDVKRFYRYHFIGKSPKSVELKPISRTVGSSTVVDEMIFSFTHDMEMDWMLPGVAPTGKKVEIPLVAIVQFRNGKVYSEHIYWDQASVLVQLGLLNPRGLPIAGVETAHKLENHRLASNTLMGQLWKNSEGKPL